MSVKTRGIGIATIALLVVVYAATRTATDESEKKRVTVTGMWLDSPRLDGVQVIVSVGSNTKTTVHLNAPFGPKSYKVPRGTRVMIRIRLLGPSGAKALACSVSVDGLEMMTTPRTIGVGPGTEVMCWATA